MGMQYSSIPRQLFIRMMQVGGLLQFQAFLKQCFHHCWWSMLRPHCCQKVSRCSRMEFKFHWRRHCTGLHSMLLTWITLSTWLYACQPQSLQPLHPQAESAVMSKDIEIRLGVGS